MSKPSISFAFLFPEESAESEPAWAGIGEEAGLRVWRIVDFVVTEWDKSQYGRFFAGDSYIVLNTYVEPDGDELKYDVHFWIGKHSTQDEYGTAAYKTVELDTFLDDKAVQHREVQGHESELFRTYFANLVVMEGGADSGFNHVTEEEYRKRLLHFSGKRKTITVREVPACKEGLKSSDVYILDLGKKVIQWNGEGANKDEKFKAAQYLNELKSERGDCESEVVDEDGLSSRHEFYENLTEEPSEETDSDDDEDEEGEHKLLRLTETGGDVEEVKTGPITREDLVSDDVFVVDTGKEVIVWIGSNASAEEKKNGLPYAHKYLKEAAKTFLPVTVVSENQTCAALDIALSA
ncbi:hypothetical protein ScPMuIL_008038 [Solemya velum]